MPEDTNRTASMIFVTDALVTMFHSSPVQFIALLMRDGTKFLRFYWSEVEKNLNINSSSPPFELNYVIRRPSKNTTIILIKLPKPSMAGESYFVALIFRPDRVTPILRISDTTKVITLEFFSQAQDKPVTQLVEWDHKLQREVVSPGPEAFLEDFYNTVLGLIKD